MTREEALEQYRIYRKACVKIQTGAITKIPVKLLLETFKQLNLSDGKRLLTGAEKELELGYDLALYITRPGRSTTAIERYAKTFASEDWDEIGVMRALCRSSFSIWEVVRRHEVAGLVVEDMLRGGEHWLMDETLEKTAIPNTVVAMRLVQPDEFVISCGVAIPLEFEVAMGIIATLLSHLPEEQWESALHHLADSTRLPRTVYNYALDLKLMEDASFQ